MVNDQEVTNDNAAFSLLNGYNRQKRMGGLGISMHIDEIDPYSVRCLFLH